MAEEFQSGSGNWWESSTRNRYDQSSTVGSTTTAASTSSNTFVGWPTDIVVARSSIDSTVSLSGHESCPPSDGVATAGGLLPESGTLQMMDLSLSSQTMDWNSALFRGDKVESSFRSMLQEEASSGNFQHQQQQEQWNRHKLYPANSEDSSNISSRGGLSLDQSQFSSNISGGNNSFQLDSSATYGTSSPNHHVLQGLLVSDDTQQHQQHPAMNYSYPISSSSYGGMNSSVVDHHHRLMAAPSWSNHNNNLPQFLRTSSPPKHPAPVHQPHHGHGQLHFSNNTPFWNASSSAPMNDVRSSLFPSSLQSQIPLPNFEDKSKNTSDQSREVATAKKSSNETSSNKRPRNEAPAPMPAFKVRKEKMGDRITALQQLVSPFGKTDTASVLSEAIEYIKFLHDQVSVLCTPYMKSGAPMTHYQDLDKSTDQGDGPKQDLRSRGLCLVPISSTFPVTQETTVDFWTPTTFGAPFR